MSVLIPLNKNKSMFEGILEVDDNYYHICIEKSTVVTRYILKLLLKFSIF